MRRQLGSVPPAPERLVFENDAFDVARVQRTHDHEFEPGPSVHWYMRCIPPQHSTSGGLP